MLFIILKTIFGVYWKYLILKSRLGYYFRELNKRILKYISYTNILSLKPRMSFQERLQDKTNKAKEEKKSPQDDIFAGQKEKKLTKKQQLVEDYLQVKLEYLQKFDLKSFVEFEVQLEKFPDEIRKRISKMKMVDLQDELAQMFAKLASAPTPEEANHGAEALFQLNVVLVRGIEEMSMIGDAMLDQRRPDKERTISLEGLTKDTLDQELIIKPILAEIYEEYKEDIDKYLTPWARLSMVYTQMSLARLAKNNVSYGEKKRKRQDRNYNSNNIVEDNIVEVEADD